MDKVAIEEFVKDYEKDETCFIVEVNVLNDDIVIFANNEASEDDLDNGWLTVFENTESLELAEKLASYLNSIKKDSTHVYIEFGNY